MKKAFFFIKFLQAICQREEWLCVFADRVCALETLQWSEKSLRRFKMADREEERERRKGRQIFYISPRDGGSGWVTGWVINSQRHRWSHWVAASWGVSEDHPMRTSSQSTGSHTGVIPHHWTPISSACLLSSISKEVITLHYVPSKREKFKQWTLKQSKSIKTCFLSC